MVSFNNMLLSNELFLGSLNYEASHYSIKLQLLSRETGDEILTSESCGQNSMKYVNIKIGVQ